MINGHGMNRRQRAVQGNIDHEHQLPAGASAPG